MTAPTTRPRRSRAGLLLFIALLAAAAWEIVGRLAAPALPRPLTYLRAALGAFGDGAPPGAPSADDMALMAYRPLPYVVYGLKPDWTRTGELRKTSNSLGFRGREVEQPKPAGRYRIVCLGGSTTYDELVNDDETYPVRLEHHLRAARPARDIEVVNAGVPSYTTAENIANLSIRLLDLQPDAIVLYEGINDWRPRTYRDFQPSYFHYRKVWDGSARLWERGEGEMGGGINPFIQHDSPDENGDDVENARAAGPGAFRRNLTSLAGIARAHGVAVVMVSNTLDESSKWLKPGTLAGIRQHNTVIREVCAEQDALFVDLDAQYPKGADMPEGGLWGKDDFVHNNARGADIKARLVADGILAGLLP